VQAMNRPARRSGPTNTEPVGDYEQCCNYAFTPLCNFAVRLYPDDSDD